MSGIPSAIFSTFFSLWWMYVPLILFLIFRDVWLKWRRDIFVKSLTWTTLDVRIPETVEKTPKAMEQVFSGLHAIHDPPKFHEKWFQGKVQLWISFDIVGLEGGVAFFVRFPSQFRNLVEAQIYAQYPQAEITEVEDYTQFLPEHLPDKDYELWGSELQLTKEDAYPIRTYPAFEETQEERRIDPISAIAEALSKLQGGEQVWVQMVIRPVDEKWREAGEKIVSKLIGKREPEKEPSVVRQFTENLLKAPYQVPEWGAKKDEKEKPVSLMQFLSPGERAVVEAIEINISKLGFETGIRFLYVAKREVFNKVRVAEIIGAFRLFNTQNLNGFKPNKKVSTAARFPGKGRREFLRKIRIWDRARKHKFTKEPFIFNTEELATVYHYPSFIVQAPVVPRVEAERGAPPITLPTE